MNIKLVFIVGFGGWFLPSCITTYRVSSVPAIIPVVFQPMFQSCYPVDHEAILNVFKDGNREFSSSMVWNFPNESSATIQFNSPIGDTIFEAEKKSEVWSSSGQIHLTIKEERNDIISINDYKVPILSSELGCILSGAWPSEWLSKLVVKDRKTNTLALFGGDQFREITVDAHISKGGENFRASDIKSCAVIKWGGFLGIFRRTAQICREQTEGNVTMKITGINNIIVDWKILNES